MTSLTIVPPPISSTPAEVALWLRQVGLGAVQLIQEAACREPDELLRSACVWLGHRPRDDL